MPIVILIAAALAFVAAYILKPESRTILRAIALVFVLTFAGVALFKTLVPEPEVTTIPVADIVLEEVTITPSVRGVNLRARVENKSQDQELREFKVTLKLHDCPQQDSDLGDCAIIGETYAIARPDIPPLQTRGINAHFVFRNLPDPIGETRFNWSISEIDSQRY